MYKLTSLSLLAVLSACGNKDNSDTSDSVAVQSPETQGRVSGFVVSETGESLDFVSVRAQGVLTHTSEDGSYTLEGLQPSDNLVVEYSKKGYAKNYEVVTLIDWETVASNTTLLAIDGSQTISSWDVDTVTVNDVSISFQPDQFINDKTGERYNGDVLVEVTYVNPYTSDIDGAPRDLSANGTDGSSQLVSYGMVDVSLYGENNEKLSVNAPAQVRFPIVNGDLPENLQLTAGSVQTAWSFDTQQGVWVDEGQGEIVAVDGELQFSFKASHFSWWNCDQGFVPSCAEGRVIDFLGFPIRGAQVTCDGGQTVSTATTDADGRYTCSIMVGDSVTFKGDTYVGNRLWSKQEGAFFMDSEGSSAADCEPIRDIQIDVCRIAGAVNVENYDAIINHEEGVDAPADGLSAVFWEPPGDTFYCENPWDSLAVGDCWSGTNEEIVASYPRSAFPGVPQSARSAGSWVKVSNERNGYEMQKELIGNLPYYNWWSHEWSDDELLDIRPDFKENDVVSVEADGDFNTYFGPWSISEFATVPTQAHFADSSLVGNRGSLNVSYQNGGDSDVIFFSAILRDQQVMCKFANTGNFTVPASAFSGFSEGWGGASVFNFENKLSAGPDGLPIYSQVFSGQTVPFEIE